MHQNINETVDSFITRLETAAMKQGLSTALHVQDCHEWYGQEDRVCNKYSYFKITK